jgi:hypothetical protein
LAPSHGAVSDLGRTRRFHCRATCRNHLLRHSCPRSVDVRSGRNAGERLDLSQFSAKKDQLRTYKEIGEFVMSKIAALGEGDRRLYVQELTTEDAEEKTLKS